MQHAWKVILVLLAGVLVFIGLTDVPKKQAATPGQPQAATPGQPRLAQATAVAMPTFASDESLTTDAYVQLGLPAPSKEWSGNDLAKAAQVLTDLAQKGYRQLPRFESERSGEVFSRLISPQNLARYTSSSEPLATRLGQLVTAGHSLGRMFQTYLMAFNRKDVRDTDMVELVGVQLRCTVIMIKLASEFESSIKSDDPQRQLRLRNLETMKQGLSEIVSGCVMTLQGGRAFRQGELIKFVGFMKETFPVIMPEIKGPSYSNIVRQLEVMQRDPAYAYLQPGLGEVLAMVKAAAVKQTAS